MSKIHKICPGCGQLTPQELLNSVGVYCKPCHAARARHWRALNKQRNREIQDAYLARKRDKSRKAALQRKPLSPEELKTRRARNQYRLRDEKAKFVFEHLRIHPCVDCGESNPLRLTFDHVRGKKVCDISTAHSTKPWSIKDIKEEMDKCDVRCWNCHMEKTARTFGYRRVRLWDEYRGLA